MSSLSAHHQQLVDEIANTICGAEWPLKKGCLEIIVFKTVSCEKIKWEIGITVGDKLPPYPGILAQVDTEPRLWIKPKKGNESDSDGSKNYHVKVLVYNDPNNIPRFSCKIVFCDAEFLRHHKFQMDVVGPLREIGVNVLTV